MGTPPPIWVGGLENQLYGLADLDHPTLQRRYRKPMG